jgi:ribosomal protein S27E
VERTREQNGLVRCLDCGTQYVLVSEAGEVAPCPGCGGIGWVSVDAVRKVDSDDDS